MAAPQGLNFAGIPEKKPDAPALNFDGIPEKKRDTAVVDPAKLRELNFGAIPPDTSTHDEFLTGRAPTILDRLATGGSRIVGSIVGGLVGAAAGTEVPIVGNAAGAVAGGAAGAAGGDYLAQRYEVWRGLRKKVSGAQTLTEAVLGVIPGGKFIKGGSLLKNVAKEAAKGAALSGGATVAQTALERGELPAFKDVGTAAVMGALMGGTLGAGLQLHANRGGRPGPSVGAVEGVVPAQLEELPIKPVASHEQNVRSVVERGTSASPEFGIPPGTQEIGATPNVTVAAKVKDEPIVTSKILPDDVDVEAHELGTLGAAKEIPPADAPVPRNFMDNPREVREQVRRIMAEMNEFQFEQGRVLTGDELDANVAEKGFQDRPGVREAYEANPDFPNLKKMNPNAPVFQELKRARQKPGSKAQAGSDRKAVQIRNAGTRYIEGKGKPTAIAEDIVRLARQIARGEKKFPGAQLPEDAGKVAEDFASTRPDVEVAREYETELPERFASTAQLTGEATPNVTAPVPSGPDVPTTRKAPGQMSEEQALRGIQLKGFDQSVRPALRGMLTETGGFEAQRRGVQSFTEHTQELANQIQVDIKNSLPKGRALNAEETVAYANRLAEATDRVTSLASKVKEGTATPQETLQLAAATQEQYVLQKSLWGSVTETGRALNAWRLLMGVLETGDTQFMKWAIKQGVGDDMEQLAAKLGEIGDDPVARFQWMKEQVNAKMSKLDMLKSYYYGNLLSGLATHERNFLSNTSNLVFSIMSDVGTGKLGAAKASGRGIASALFSRVGEKPAGAALALPKAFQTFVDELKYGFNPANLEGSGMMRGGGNVARELPGGVKNPWNAVRRALDAADGFFRVLVTEGEKNRAAYQIAKHTPSADFDTVFAKALKNLPADKLREIEDITTRGVFQEQQGKIGQAMMGLQKIPGMWLAMPFVRIASNITRQGLEVTPAGFFMKGAKQTGRVGELARTRAATGSLLLAPIAAYAAAGRITGNGPSDPGKRAAWLADGKKPNSIWNPATGEWVSYQAWQPMALPMSMVANLVESGKEIFGANGKKVPDESLVSAYSEMAAQVVMRTAGSVMDQSFLSGLDDLLSALKEPERKAARLVQNLAVGFTPMSGALRTAAQVTDRTQRAPRGPVEAIEAVTPGLSKKVQPLIDRFGEPTDVSGNPLIRGFYQASPAKDEALSQVLDRVGLYPQRPDAELKGVKGTPEKLSRDEQTALMMARGRARRAAYDMVVANPEFASWDVEQQKAALERAASAGIGAVAGRAKAAKATGQTLTVSKLLGER